MNFNTAKNVILFLGDGMSIPTIAATRVYLGGEEKSLSFEQFPYTGLSKTYCVDHQTADSACSATAYLGGVKANLGTIGVTAAVKQKNCSAMNMKENQVDSIARLFQLKGKRTGVVTTTRVTHATPAGIYAHTSERDWESDTDVMNFNGDITQCEDIAHQLIFGSTGRNLNVILGLHTQDALLIDLGGGRKNFLPREVQDEDGNSGDRSDGVNLIEEWKRYRESQGQLYEYVWNRERLFNVKENTEYLLGLFQPDHLNYNLERDPQTQPSLEEMTEAALRVLDKPGSSGYFLLVEGGRIDTAHHLSWARKALDETAEFSKAVQKALSLTNQQDTLIVVTSDHAHTMSYAGYAARGSDVFGYAGTASDEDPYTILNYANGPGYKPFMATGQRYVPSLEEMNNLEFQWPSTVPKKKETHGADDVAIFANGPWSHLFSGVMEENVIPYLIGLASCVSPYIKCEDLHPKLP
ncbi:hypothetical protein D910_01329 [Dendroctonus ponderosae]|uniref:alkaline phosphatase n=1 Tax=Dendroctonus ponderosae TaxID=77166 RepID=U4U1W8_DENPD|nr:hypothetical protein D910_01329 [Dendroctonus ponderosae]